MQAQPATGRPPSMAPDKARRATDDDEARPYVIVNDIGKGSFATVYKGYHEETHQTVAIKSVRRDILTAKLFDNLQSEIEILKSLSHRHITKLINIVRADRNIFLIMEYCAGGDLTNYIKKRGRVEGLEYAPTSGAALQYYPHPRSGGLDEVVVRSFLRQLARALKFLRTRNLIHRDIKPQNLLLNPASPEELAKGHPIGVPILKVADFGFARSLPKTMLAETLCGSPLYMAPEILRYEKYDAKADLWSVGAVLYEMCVGKPPFRAQNHVELLKKIEQSKGVKFPDEDPPRATSNHPTPHSAASTKPEEPQAVPSDIKELIRALLRRRPAERASFEEFFKSEALAKSKFPRPAPEPPLRATTIATALSMQTEEDDDSPIGRIPEHHKVIPPEVLDPKAMIPPSKFHFRRRETSDDTPTVVAPGPSFRSSPSSRGQASKNPLETAQTRADAEPDPVTENDRGRPVPKFLSTEGSIIPGESEEDGIIRKEYVLVGDVRALEFNRAVDELSTARRRTSREHRTAGSPLVDETYPSDHVPPSPRSNSPLTAPIPTTYNTTFPPPPHPLAPPLSSSPTRVASNALSRALSLASRKHAPPSPRRPQILLRSPTNEGDVDKNGVPAVRDPMEDELLAALEELAQKTDVLTHWADEMYEAVKAVPQKPLPDPTKFARREGEAEKHAERRRNADQEAEYTAVTCVAVYMLLMSFSQKGIDKLRNYQEHLRMRYPDGDFVVSQGFDDALAWFKEQFIKCNDRAALVKTWLPVQYDGPRIYLDQLVYDRALVLSRTAARKELLDQATSPDECEKLYEESLWCLYTLQDDLQQNNPFMEEDRNTIATWITRTKLRLVRCRARMSMNDRDRMKDALADQNLVDARYPPPWDPQALEKLEQQQQAAAGQRS
ncbi:kinase-like domain-containing protein [Boletus edulis BED1]|uniref:non-specific serine/threonine protein kinase n=1 Tax=Boletus edulis BED1 TaxID=1328754 RepID=A0AAD4C9B3_BOLED|nr:kinase-like domain-containing protein [Boletus edulis BED1]